MNWLALLWDRLISAFCWWLCAALPHRARVIPHAEDPGKPLLQQFLVYSRPAGKKPSLSVYLQHFITPESPEFAHRHRWHYMRSFVLSGYFVEHRYRVDRDNEMTKLHRRLSTYTMDHETIHNVYYWSRYCWTLFFAVDATDDWGYYPIYNSILWGPRVLNFIHWRDHIKQRVEALETGKITP